MTSRLRALYHARPLFDMRRSSAHGNETADYDVVVLAFKLLDILAEETGLGEGITSEDAAGGLLPLLMVMDQEAGRDPDVERHRRVAQKVLEYLLNRGESSRQFQIEYLSTIGPDGKAERKVLSFRLIAEVYGPHGVVLRLTPEAVNLIFRMLAVDLESSMAATEAILEHLLKRGRFDEAVRSAQQALKQAGVYRLKIKVFRQNVRSDILMELGSDALREAMEFVQERQEKDAILLNQIGTRRNDLRKGETSQDEIESRFHRLTEIYELIHQCAGLYASLGHDILDAQREFTLEHGRQCLRAKPRYRRYPNLMTEQAPPIFLAPLAKVESGLLAFYQRLAGHRPPERFSFSHLMNPLKRPLPTEESLEAFEEKEILHEAFLAQISAEDWAWVHRFVGKLEKQTRLSELLKEAKKDDKLNGPRRLGVLIEVIRAYVFGAEKPGVKLTVTVPDSVQAIRWRDLEFYGDDLVVEPLVVGGEAVEEEAI
jgi:tetratricopeptide (TPR) repeat protein